MVPDTFLEEYGHLKVRVAQQCRNADDGRKYLCQERTATVPDQQIRIFLIANSTDKTDCYLGMYGQVWRQDLGLPVKRLFQCHRGNATAGSEETVKE